MSQQSKPTSFLVMLVVLAVTLLLVSSLLTPNTAQILPYSDVLDLFRNEKVASFTLEGSNLTMQVRGDDGDTASTVTAKIGNTEQFREDLDALIADQYADGTLESYNYLPVSEPWYRAAAPYIIGGVVLIALFFFLSSRANGGPNGMANFTKANARFGIPTSQTVTFQDVAGADEEKEELAQIVDFLRDPKRYSRLGAKIPKGVLLVGPPGTGKTLLARAVAGEAGVSFLSISGSDFVELYVGVGASRVRDLFEQAKKVAPAIIFIDEIDAVGRRRGAGLGGGHDEREQTLNQLLSEMDGFDGSSGVVILAATNRPETLDKALLRPGRFDRRVPVELPDLQGREAILRVHAKDVMMADDIDYKAVARATSGASGAELANLINEAALRAVKCNRRIVTQEDLTESVDVVVAGYQRKNAVLSPHEKEIVAYHEIGHALVAALQSNSAPVTKITIVPRTSGALGYTMQTPEADTVLLSKEEALAKIATLTGGRSAEELIFGSVTSGASNDIEQATKLARSMVTRLGMSETFDMTALETVSNQYLGGDAALACSAETATKIDKEVVEIIRTAHEKAIGILKDNLDKLHELAKYLLEKETITGDEFMAILNR